MVATLTSTTPSTAVLVLGLGDSGLAMARWSARAGHAVRIWDSRDSAPHDAELANSLPQATRLRGALVESSLSDVGQVLVSPGLSPHDARIAPVLQIAKARNIRVGGELSVFNAALADLQAAHGYRPNVVAITGTNGKTTTTAMAALLIARAGRNVAVAGNIGPSMLDTLSAVLSKALQGDGSDQVMSVAELPEVWVLELSSFQLHGVQGFEPDAAAWLNLTPDHLDWHGSLDAYAQAKANIFGSRTVCVVNQDDPAVMAHAMADVAKPEAQIGVKSRRAMRAPAATHRKVLRFGLGAPQFPGDYGVVTENGMAWLVRALPNDEPAGRSKSARAAAQEIHLQRLMPADALRVRGRHNAANALAALALADAIGCPLAPMLHGLREYAGEPHRVAFVARVGEVDAFDDSKGTNVGATVAALTGLGADRDPARLIVILGGDGKGQDFAALAAPVARHARAVATIGKDAGAIEAALAACGIPLLRHTSLEDATRWAFGQAQSGDAVLLSPACASLDMFRNYSHRADVFVAQVQVLAAESGGVA